MTYAAQACGSVSAVKRLFHSRIDGIINCAWKHLKALKTYCLCFSIGFVLTNANICV